MWSSAYTYLSLHHLLIFESSSAWLSFLLHKMRKDFLLRVRKFRLNNFAYILLGYIKLGWSKRHLSSIIDMTKFRPMYWAHSKLLCLVSNLVHLWNIYVHLWVSPLVCRIPFVLSARWLSWRRLNRLMWVSNSGIIKRCSTLLKRGNERFLRWIVDKWWLVFLI